MDGTSIVPFLANEPFVVNADMLLAATLAADKLGRQTVARVGDAAYRALHDH